ncbi:hypothetical protein [Lactococcus lactis]
MKTEVVCKECYDNICQYCQKGKPEHEMTETKGHVTVCLECKRK